MEKGKRDGGGGEGRSGFAFEIYGHLIYQLNEM